MKRLRVFLAPLLACVLAAVALAQSGGEYDLSWSTVAGGGGTSEGGTYTVQGAIGQHDAGGAQIQGGDFSVQGGYLVPQPPTATPTPTPLPGVTPTATPTKVGTPTPTATAVPIQATIYLPLVVQ